MSTSRSIKRAGNFAASLSEDLANLYELDERATVNDMRGWAQNRVNEIAKLIDVPPPLLTTSPGAYPMQLARWMRQYFGTAYSMEDHIFLEKNPRALSARFALPVSKFGKGSPGQIKTLRIDMIESNRRIIAGLRNAMFTLSNLCENRSGGSGLSWATQTSAFSFSSPDSSTDLQHALYVTVKYGPRPGTHTLLGFAQVEQRALNWEIELFCAQGVGRQQMQTILDDARAAPNVTGVSLHAVADAVTFYRKMGFKNVHGILNDGDDSCEDSDNVKEVLEKYGGLPNATSTEVIMATPPLREFFEAVCYDSDDSSSVDMKGCLNGLFPMHTCFPEKMKGGAVQQPTMPVQKKRKRVYEGGKVPRGPAMKNIPPLSLAVMEATDLIRQWITDDENVD